MKWNILLLLKNVKLKPYKHTEMDLGFVGFCFQRCPMWYSKCCLKRAEIKLNQRVLLRIDNCIPKYNSFTFIFCIIFFLDLKRNCISRWESEIVFFFLEISCTYFEVYECPCVFYGWCISDDVNPKVRQEFCKQKSGLIFYLCMDN